MKSAIAACALVALSGCAGTGMHYNDLVGSGNVTIDELDANAGTYRVGVLNTVDFGWNGGSRQDREKVVDHFFKDRCKSTEILSDNPVQMGTYNFTTKPRIKHSMVVRCAQS
jgi:hypothetical protein